MTCRHHYHWCQHQSSGCSLQESTRGYEGNKHGPPNYDWHRHHKPACVDIYMYTYTHTYTQMLERNVSNASRKDEGQWEYKEVHLLRGEEKQGNKTVMSSQESADGTHTYTQVQRDKRESVKQIKPSLLLFIPCFVQRRPPFTSSLPHQHLSGKRVINV